MAAGTIRVFVPTGRDPGNAGHAEGRPARASTAGFAIGLLDNHKHNTDKVLDYLEQRLGEHYKDAHFIRIKKAEAGKGAPKSMIEGLASDCRAVITGIGD